MRSIFIVRDFDLKGIEIQLEDLRRRPPDGYSEVVIPGLVGGKTQGQIFNDAVRGELARSTNVLAFVDLPNANVGFEIGYALGMGKPVALTRVSATVPEWLGEPPLAGYLAPAARTAKELRELICSDDWIVPPRKPALGQAIVFICPESTSGASLHDSQKKLYPDWSVLPPTGWSLPQITDKLEGVGKVVWCLTAYPRDTDERDGRENAADAIVAGFANACGIELCVLRHEDARPVADLQQWEHRFSRLDEFEDLLSQAVGAGTGLQSKPVETKTYRSLSDNGVTDPDTTKNGTFKMPLIRTIMFIAFCCVAYLLVAAYQKSQLNCHWTDSKAHRLCHSLERNDDSVLITLETTETDFKYSAVYINSDGNRSTGYLRRNGADWLLNNNRLSPYDTNSCHSESTEWCWNEAASLEVNWYIENVSASNHKEIWQVPLAHFSGCPGNLEIVSDIKFEPSSKYEHDRIKNVSPEAIKFCATENNAVVPAGMGNSVAPNVCGKTFSQSLATAYRENWQTIPYVASLYQVVNEDFSSVFRIQNSNLQVGAYKENRLKYEYKYEVMTNVNLDAESSGTVLNQNLIALTDEHFQLVPWHRNYGLRWKCLSPYTGMVQPDLMATDSWFIDQSTDSFETADPKKNYQNRSDRMDDSPTRVATFDCNAEAILIIKPDLLALFHDMRHDTGFCHYRYSAYDITTGAYNNPSSEYTLQDGSSFTVEVSGVRHQWEFSATSETNSVGYIYGQQLDQREIFLLDAREAKDVDLERLAELLFEVEPIDHGPAH